MSSSQGHLSQAVAPEAANDSLLLAAAGGENDEVDHQK